MKEKDESFPAEELMESPSRAETFDRRRFVKGALSAAAVLAFMEERSLCAALAAERKAAMQKVVMQIGPDTIRLTVGDQTWRFTRESGRWALASIEVRGSVVARVLSRNDSFFLGGGEATEYEVRADRPDQKEVAFMLGQHRAVFSTDARDHLPFVHVRLEGPETPTFALRSAQADTTEHGAWITRGWVATDHDAQEAFIDSSNPIVFGHSAAADLDTAYLFLPRVNPHVQKNGRTEQRSVTHFKSTRLPTGDGAFAGAWELRMGKGEPKAFSVLLDRDLGGRVSDVCEKYFAGAVDALVDLASIPNDFDPDKCLQVMPLRLAAPDAFTPGYGWMMDEYPEAAYPFGTDSALQSAAFLAYEGLATGRKWEQNFARYVLDKTPLEGKDGESFFVRRPGGLVRWGYASDYNRPFPRLDGGVWWGADVLYRTAQALDDPQLRAQALDMVKHDLHVKLDLNAMSYPPTWNPVDNGPSDDRRDDWFKTPGLAWCAWAAAKIAYPETKDPVYLKIADRICDWFAGFLGPETKLNFLQDNNMHAVFSHYIPLALLDKYERSKEKRFLEMARDMAWVHIMTACTTPARDDGGYPITGTTCVGVRGCVDYDCSPNLCHEKDLNFVHMIGPLLDHVSGPAYGKYLKLQELVLAKDSWRSAWVNELRDTNLRTMYDTFARGMANLIYALNLSSDPQVVALEKLASKGATAITHARDIALSNATMMDRETTLRVRYLSSGIYNVSVDGKAPVQRTEIELERGMKIRIPANTMVRVEVKRSKSSPAVESTKKYDRIVTYLSDLEPFGAQRGVGLPQPTYRKDRSFGDGPLRLDSKAYEKGLGCASNTVLIYKLAGRYERFRATVGVDGEAAEKDPGASVFFTAFVDGKLAFESGPMRGETPSKEADVDVRGAKTLMLRLSGNWDDGGKTDHDYGNWAEARLVGKTLEPDRTSTSTKPP